MASLFLEVIGALALCVLAILVIVFFSALWIMDGLESFSEDSSTITNNLKYEAPTMQKPLLSANVRYRQPSPPRYAFITNASWKTNHGMVMDEEQIPLDFSSKKNEAHTELSF